MGDMADELIDMILDQDFEDYADDSRAVCKHCGKSVFWQETTDGWRLFENRPHGSIAPHRCNRGLTPKKIISNFDDIS